MIDRNEEHSGEFSGPLVAVTCSKSRPESNPAAAHLIHEIHDFIGREMHEVERLIEDSVRSAFHEVQRLSRQASTMGGKRLRPLLVLLSAKASGTTTDPHAMADLCRVAASVELVHAASLVHDDVMDAAHERRHRPTIAGQSGNSSAILLGDFLFTRAFALASACRSTTPARRIADASAELCEGELRQQLAAGNWHLSAREYRGILSQKTGALCAVSCRLGAGRSSPQGRRALSRFGMLLGLAFQIFDDWLDYWGTDLVGKTLGTDLRQQKATLPVIRLLRTAPPAQRQRLLLALENGSPAEQFAETLRMLDASDASQYTLAAANRCAARAKAALGCLAPSQAKTHLLALADFSVRRPS